MPKRINRIRGILRPLLTTCSRNNAIHEISSAESKCIIFCRASALLPTQSPRVAHTPPSPREAGIVA